MLSDKSTQYIQPQTFAASESVTVSFISCSFMSCYFMSCIFMSCHLVRHFHVQHFQRPRRKPLTAQMTNARLLLIGLEQSGIQRYTNTSSEPKAFRVSRDAALTWDLF